MVSLSSMGVGNSDRDCAVAIVALLCGG